MKLKIIVLGFSILAVSLSAQTSFNGLDAAKQYYDDKQYAEVINILSKYLNNNSKDVYAHWLYGQTAHNMGEKTTARIHFQTALKLQPDNEDIRIAYARSLFFSKQLEEASNEFEKIITVGKNQNNVAEGHLMLSYIDFWNLNLDNSRYHVDQILKINPSDQLALQQKDAIRQISSPYLKLNLEYLDDDQPLRTFSEKIEFGMVRNRALNFAFTIKNYNFNTHNQVIAANLKNTFTLSDVDMYITLSVGISKHFKDKYDWHGEISINKKVIDHLYIKAGLDRHPYLYTEKSTYKSVAENNYYATADYDNPDLFSANLIYQNKFFKGDNQISTIGGWAMSKYFKFGLVQARAGYSVTYSDTKHSTYVPDVPIESYPLGDKLPGYYNFYFSPDNQMIHSVLGALRFGITSKLMLNVFGSYGFSAWNNAPLLFSLHDDNGNYTFLRTSYKEKYHPYNLKVNLDYMLSEKASIGLYYGHQKTSFYNQDKAGIQLYYKF